jgi:hypothetical protein
MNILYIEEEAKNIIIDTEIANHVAEMREEITLIKENLTENLIKKKIEIQPLLLKFKREFAKKNIRY